jgi:plasmid maintenance system antidote protein VapI
MHKRPDLKIHKVVSIKSGSSKQLAGTDRPIANTSAKISAMPAVKTTFNFSRVTNVIYPQEFLPRGDELAVRWAREIDAAMEAWGNLDKAELVETGGYAHNLSRLVEERYDISRDEAETLVRFFYAKQNFQSADWR